MLFIICRKSKEYSTQFDLMLLMLLYEKVFPGHIALLAARIDDIVGNEVLLQLAYDAL